MPSPLQFCPLPIPPLLVPLFEIALLPQLRRADLLGHGDRGVRENVPALSHHLAGAELGGPGGVDVAGNVWVHPGRAEIVVGVVVVQLVVVLLLAAAGLAHGDDAAGARHAGDGLRGGGHQANRAPACKDITLATNLIIIII